MRAVVRLALNDVRLTLKDKPAFFWLLLTPLAMMAFFGAMHMSNGAAPKVALTVIDRDGGWMAEAFAKELAGPGVALDLVPPTGADAALAKHPRRWIELPNGFTESVLAGRQQKLRIETDKEAPADASRAAEVLTARAIVRTLGRLAELKQSGTPPTPEALEALKSRPPLVALAVDTAGRGTAVPSGTEQSVPGTLTFCVLMMTLIYGAIFLTIEKREGMLWRQLSLPVGRGTLFAGKVAGRLLIAAMQIAVLVLAGRYLFHVRMGHAPFGLAALLLSYAFAVAGIATFLGAVLKNPEQASAVGWLASMVMGAMGGCWWPAEVMPGWLRTASHVFPTAWAMDAFHALISFGKSGSAVALPCVVLIGFGVVFSAWGAFKLDATVGA